MDEKELREIEEMVRDYYPNETASSECIQDSIAKGGYANIVALYDKGIRKVPEGAVVISKEEYDDLKRRPSTREWVDTCRGRMEQASKETAKQIFQRLFDICFDDKHHYCIEAADIKFIARREYGVEVDG